MNLLFMNGINDKQEGRDDGRRGPSAFPAPADMLKREAEKGFTKKALKQQQTAAGKSINISDRSAAQRAKKTAPRRQLLLFCHGRLFFFYCLFLLCNKRPLLFYFAAMRNTSEDSPSTTIWSFLENL